MSIRLDVKYKTSRLNPKNQTVFSINGREPKDYNFVMKGGIPVRNDLDRTNGMRIWKRNWSSGATRTRPYAHIE
jgi:hypothetical protein